MLAPGEDKDWAHSKDRMDVEGWKTGIPVPRTPQGHSVLQQIFLFFCVLKYVDI
jgi:hypothetical protein